MIAGGGDLMQKGARRLRPVEDSPEGGQAGSSSWSWGEFLCSNVIQSGRLLILQNNKNCQNHTKSYPPIKVTLELQRDPEETASGGISLSFSIGEIHYTIEYPETREI